MLLYSLIFPIVAIIAIVWFLARYVKGKNSLITVIIWTLFWLLVVLFAVFPNISNTFAGLFGITRGLDFVILLVFVALFYTIIKLHLKLDKLEDDLNKVVKQVAINNEITLEDEEE